MSSLSMKDILVNVKISNYISIVALTFLMLLIISKFHLNKNINNAYIWLMLLILIFSIAISAYMFNDLYTNINNYIYMYLKK